MSIPIRTIPILEAEAAERFIKEAEESLEKAGTIDFSEQTKICDEILKKSGFK